MPLTATDLLEPKGALDRLVMWPKVPQSTVAGNLGQYLDDGYARATALAVDAAELDEAARQWAYHRAYANVAQRLNARPASVNIGQQGSANYLTAQIAHWTTLAQQALSAFEALTPVVEDEGDSYAVITSLR